MRDDYARLLRSLQLEPLQGVDLGNGVRKIRLAIKSKGKGKSGGARVITFNVEHVKEELIVITLLTIYDKSEMVSVSDSYIKQLVLSIIE